MVVCQLLFTLWSKYIHCCYDENTGLREKKNRAQNDKGVEEIFD